MSSNGYQIWKSSQFAGVYLDGVRGAMPCTVEHLDVMLRLIRATGRPVQRVLDLGCGDGILASAILAEHPDAHAVLLDFSETMLIAAREKMARFANRVHFVEHDLADPGWVQAVNEHASFDAIVSGLAIHHQTDERKRAIYAEIHGLLAPGAMFVNIEHVSSPTEWLADMWRECFSDALYEQRRAQGHTESREEVLNTMRQRMAEGGNILASVESQCQWLREIGYIDVDCYFKLFEIAVFGGRRAT